MAVKPIPDGYHTVTPYLIVTDPAGAIEFYKKAFGATEKMRMPGPDGKIAHAEIQIGDSPIMMGGEAPAMGAHAPQAGKCAVGICLYVPDVDAMVAKAVAAGGKLVRPVQDQFYGDRSGTITDPYGHQWTVSTHKEDVPPGEMHKRMEAAMKNMPAAPKKQGK